MPAFSDSLDACDRVGESAARQGIGLLQADDGPLDGRHVCVDGESKLQFLSCSYLGLELDPRLVEAAVSAARRYGTQFSASRAFISAPAYRELEERLSELTGGPTLVTPSTTMASAAALPSLVGEHDAVLLDHQVHMTVQLVAPLLQRLGIPVEFVRHGRLDRLEERIRDLRERHERIWFLLDGVYSMHGDLARMPGLAWLLSRYEQLHLYVDDAHATGWTGKHGRGHALEQLPDRERVIVALSLNKSFAAAGGALVLPDEATRRRVRNTAGPLLFGGPVQPPMLGVAVASAHLHLSRELPELQAELRTRIGQVNARARELELPLLHGSAVVPIRFIGLGPQPASFAMARHLVGRGLLTSCAVFPAVPAHQTGIRLSFTRHHTADDIDHVLGAIADYLPEALAHGNVGRDDLDDLFELPGDRSGRAPRNDRVAPPATLRVEHATTIAAIDADEWDRLLGDRGSFDAAGLRTLEAVFGPHQPPENDWRFHYVVVRGADGRPVLATFFTVCRWKEDMFASAEVSREVERRRKIDPDFLTSDVVSLGAPLTEGDHLYIEPGANAADRRGALQLLVTALSGVAEDAGAPTLVLRDLPVGDAERDLLLHELGFACFPAPHAMELTLEGPTAEAQLRPLSRRARRFLRREVKPFDETYEIDVYRSGGRAPEGDDFWPRLDRLYRNVQQRNLVLNSFPLPPDLLPTLLEHPDWEIVTLSLRDEAVAPGPHAFFAARVGRTSYLPLLVGLDHREVGNRGGYRQCIATAIRRAAALGRRRVQLGLGAEFEKGRFGAVPAERLLFIQVRDAYHADVLALLSDGVHGRGSPR